MEIIDMIGILCPIRLRLQLWDKTLKLLCRSKAFKGAIFLEILRLFLLFGEKILYKFFGLRWSKLFHYLVSVLNIIK